MVSQAPEQTEAYKRSGQTAGQNPSTPNNPSTFTPSNKDIGSHPDDVPKRERQRRFSEPVGSRYIRMVRRLLQPKARRSESANEQDSREQSATSSLHQLPPPTLSLRPTNVHHPSRDTTSIPVQQPHLEPGRTRDGAVSPIKVDIPQTTPAKSRKRLPRVLQVVLGVFRAPTTRRQKSLKSQISAQTNTEAGAPANS
ncbi:hypothetical protein FRB90_005786, partial [Tulasnella sp. 427]